MTRSRAEAVLAAYKKHGYNASKALEEAGYSKWTALTKSRGVIERAERTLAQVAVDDLAAATGQAESQVLKRIRITEKDVVSHYKHILAQNKDYGTKLRALLPLLAELGVKWDTAATNVQPTVNITFNRATESMSHNMHSATQPDHIIDSMAKPAGEVRLSEPAVKEGERPSPKSSENLEFTGTSPKISENPMSIPESSEKVDQEDTLRTDPEETTGFGGSVRPQNANDTSVVSSSELLPASDIPESFMEGNDILENSSTQS